MQDWRDVENLPTGYARFTVQNTGTPYDGCAGIIKRRKHNPRTGRMIYICRVMVPPGENGPDTIELYLNEYEIGNLRA